MVPKKIKEAGKVLVPYIVSSVITSGCLFLTWIYLKDDIDRREQCHENFPIILGAYYDINDFLDRDLRTIIYSGLTAYITYYVFKEINECKDPETRKRKYYTKLKGEGIYMPAHIVYRERILDEEDKEVLKKYAS